MTQRSAAGQIWPHLPSEQQQPKARAQSGSLAEAMWPRPKPKPVNPYRESLLRHLKEYNAARMKRGGR